MSKIVIHETVSLGTFCFSAHFLRKYSLRMCSYPFDWVFSNPTIIADCFSDDYQRFLDKKQYTQHTDSGKCHHALYDPKQPLYEHWCPPFFFHHNPTREPHYQHYVRSINRLRHLLNRKTNKLFLMTYSVRSTPIPCEKEDPTGQTGDEIVSQLYHLKKIIDSHTKNAFLLVINCLEKTNEQPSSVHSRHNLYDNIIIINLYTSHIKGTEFDDANDWNLYKGQIDEIYTFKLHSHHDSRIEHDPF